MWETIRESLKKILYQLLFLENYLKEMLNVSFEGPLDDLKLSIDLQLMASPLYNCIYLFFMCFNAFIYLVIYLISHRKTTSQISEDRLF